MTDRHLNRLNKSRSLYVIAIGILTGLVASSGCGGKPALVPVSGSVSLEGKPLGLGRIQFEPADGTTMSAVGDIQDDGTFELFTTKPGDGVQPGSYYAVVLDPKEDEPAPANRRIGVVQLPKTNFEVTVDGPNDFQVVITREDVRWAVKDD